MLPFLLLALRGQAAEPVRITLAEAIRLALLHNHNLLATRTTIEQSQAQEITAGLRPNPCCQVPGSRRPSSSRRKDRRKSAWV